MALRLPEATESGHMGHPDFRVCGKIFATLGPGEEWGMVKLTPAQQAELVRAHPAAFEPAAGAWGRRGATTVRLRRAQEEPVRRALLDAWRNTAPERMTREYDED